MKFKSTIAYGVIFLGLLAFVYFHEIKGGAERERIEEEAKKMLIFDENQVTKLTLRHPDEIVVCSKKSEDEWEITSPVETEADKNAVERVIDSIKDADIDRVVADSADIADRTITLADYGLDSPTVAAHIELESGSLDTLLFGDESPTGSFAFAKRTGEMEVFTIPLWRLDNIKKKTFDLRDKRVLGFERTEVREIDLERDGELIVLSRPGDDYYKADWQMEKPIETKADKDEVRGILNELENAKAKEFVSEKPEDLKQYGLDKPSVNVTLWVGKDKAKKELKIGYKKGKQYYAKDESKDPVFLVDSTFVAKLKKDVFDLRDKKVAEFERDDVDKIELVYADSSIICQKDTLDNWMVSEPEVRKAKNWKVRGVLIDMENLKAEEFVSEEATDVSKYGLDKPQITAKLWKGDELLVELMVGDKEDGSVYVKTKDKDTVYLVKDDIIDDLSPGLDEIMEKEGV